MPLCCPICDAPFKSRKVRYGEALECAAHGIWFDRGVVDAAVQAIQELKPSIAKLSAPHRFGWRHRRHFWSQLLKAIHSEGRPNDNDTLKCPKCKNPLMTSLAGKTEVRVCTADGAWLSQAAFAEFNGSFARLGTRLAADRRRNEPKVDPWMFLQFL